MTISPNDYEQEHQKLIRELVRDVRDQDAWTPTPAQVKKAVDLFLLKEPTWLAEAVRRDPALIFNDEDKQLVATLKQENKPIPERLVKAATSQLRAYQGLHAIAFHRLAHEIYQQYDGKNQEDTLDAARKISQGIRTDGIEVHPGAEIGNNCFIDHGTGTVIGQTARIGNNVYLYHKITLGAIQGKEVTEDGQKRRHPRIGNNVIISTGAEILGPIIIEDDVQIGSKVFIKQVGKEPITIGKGAIIQDGVTITKSIPAGARVVGSVANIPGVVRNGEIGTPIMILKNAEPINDVNNVNNGKIPRAQIIGDGAEIIAKGIRSMSAANDGAFKGAANSRG